MRFIGKFRSRRDYGLAVVLVLAAAMVRVVFDPMLGPRAVYSTFYAAVIIAALMGGGGPGVLASILSALAVATCFSEQAGLLDAGFAAWFGFGVFVVSTALIAGSCEALHRALQRVIDADLQTRALKEQGEVVDALRRSEERFRVAQELSLDAFTILSPVRDGRGNIVDFRWDYANPAAGRLLRRSPEELVGTRLLEQLPGNRENSDLFDRYVRVVETGLPHDFELYYEGEGIKGWYRNMAVKLGDSMAVCFTDITMRKKAEAELQASKERFELAVRGAGVGIWDWDICAGKVYFSPRWKRLFGYEENEMREGFDDWAKLLHPEERDRIIQYQADFLAGSGSHVSAEYRLRHKDGSYRWIAAHAVVVRDHAGKACRLVGSHGDITERKLAEEALQAAKRSAEKAQAAAEESNRSKDRFLATLSHELRTPLSPVLVGVQLLRRRADLPLSVKDTLAVIERNVTLEARLIDDLLDLARLVHGKISLRMDRVNIEHLLRSAVAVCETRVKEKFLEVEFRAAAERRYVEGDEARLHQVFWNIIINAVKFTPEYGKITIETADEGTGRVVIKISDTGKGIEAERLVSIFGAFEQVESGQLGGLGLGLSISKTLIDMHHGTIAALSDGPGKGCTFVVTLPSRREAGSGGQKASASAAPKAWRILLVEDHRDTGVLMKAALETVGHKVTCTTTVAEALAADKADVYDVLLCDLALPDGSGLDIINGMRIKPVFAAALTGFGRDEDVLRSRAAGFHVHLTKPVDIDALEKLLNAA